MKKTSKVKAFVVTKARYYRTENPVEGAGAIAHCDGKASVLFLDGNFARVLFMTEYNPVSNEFSLYSARPMDIPADKVMNEAIAYAHKHYYDDNFSAKI